MGLIKNLKLGGSFADLPFSQWDGPQKKPPQRAAFPYSSIIQRDTHEFSAKIHTQFLTRFGSDLLSHALRRSTIGAAVLNCRVRDGIGCFTCAMTTKPRKEPTSVSFACRCRPGFDPGVWRGTRSRVKPGMTKRIIPSH